MSVFSRFETINKVIMIPVDSIGPNPMQPRRTFDDKYISDLADSIRTNGLLQPITVRRLCGDRFELIAGERRLIAVRSLGHSEIAAIVEEMNDEQSAVMALVENLQRQDLSFFEEASGVAALMEIWGMTQQQIAAKIGMAQSTVANKLRLLRFDDYTRNRIESSNLTERHARALLKLCGDDRLGVAIDYIAKNSLNVEKAEQYIESLCGQDKHKEKATRLFVIKDLKIFLNTINKAAGIMKQAGLDVSTRKEEDGEFIRYIVSIPKTSAYRSKNTA